MQCQRDSIGELVTTRSSFVPILLTMEARHSLSTWPFRGDSLRYRRTQSQY